MLRPVCNCLLCHIININCKNHRADYFSSKYATQIDESKDPKIISQAFWFFLSYWQTWQITVYKMPSVFYGRIKTMESALRKNVLPLPTCPRPCRRRFYNLERDLRRHHWPGPMPHSKGQNRWKENPCTRVFYTPGSSSCQLIILEIKYIL